MRSNLNIFLSKLSFLSPASNISMCFQMIFKMKEVSFYFRTSSLKIIDFVSPAVGFILFRLCRIFFYAAVFSIFNKVTLVKREKFTCN